MAKPLVGGDPKESASAQARAQELVGRTISDRYRIVELVAMGAMGAVYKGEHLLMRKRVAIKVLHPEIEDFPELVARFEREAIAGAHVNHPNVATASDFGKFDGDSYFLVLEYIEGTTLSDIIKRGPIEPARAVSIARQLAAALGAAHQRGIVHRDVKPKNIMICEPGVSDTSSSAEGEVVKLIDFGLAKVPVEKLSNVAKDPTDSRELTNAGVVMGTVAYMAPETALGMSAVQARADLYSLGIILYEMLAGAHPFDAVEPQKLFAAQCTLPPPPFAKRNAAVQVPADLEGVVMRLLEKDPDHRYADSNALIQAIDGLALRKPGGAQSGAAAPLPSEAAPAAPAAHDQPSGGHYLPRMPAQRENSSKMWMFIAAAAVTVAVVVVVFALRGSSSKGADTPATGSSAPAAGTTAAPTATSPEKSAPTTQKPTPPSSGATAPTTATPATSAADLPSDPKAAATALVELLKDVSPTGLAALKDHARQLGIATSVRAIAEADLPETKPILDALAATEPGIDILYVILAQDDPAKGQSSKAGIQAMTLLNRPDVFSRGSAAFKIAYDLRRATCQRRAQLLTRATTEGDDRTLAILKSMTAPACEPSSSPCCLVKNADLDKAITDLGARYPQ
ncbi:MAG: serine/threonine-protein kinase [Polyangiaceae bacterium]